MLTDAVSTHRVDHVYPVAGRGVHKLSIDQELHFGGLQRWFGDTETSLEVKALNLREDLPLTSTNGICLERIKPVIVLDVACVSRQSVWVRDTRIHASWLPRNPYHSAWRNICSSRGLRQEPRRRCEDAQLPALGPRHKPVHFACRQLAPNCRTLDKDSHTQTFIVFTRNAYLLQD